MIGRNLSAKLAENTDKRFYAIIDFANLLQAPIIRNGCSD